MSEIKGQLLGIVLVLIVFGGISVAMAKVFKNTSGQITSKSEDAGADAEAQLSSSIGLLSYYN